VNHDPRAGAPNWERHSVSYQHNLLWKGDTRYLFDDLVNSTSTILDP
jgi:hypothetical protein